MGMGTCGKFWKLVFVISVPKTGENNSELSKTFHKFPLPYVSYLNLITIIQGFHIKPRCLFSHDFTLFLLGKSSFIREKHGFFKKYLI